MLRVAGTAQREARVARNLGSDKIMEIGWKGLC
jgi:hypothetical protein